MSCKHGTQHRGLGELTSVVMQVGKHCGESMRVNALRDFHGLLVALRSGATSHQRHHVRLSTEKSLKREGGHVSGAERYAIGQLRFLVRYVQDAVTDRALQPRSAQSTGWL